MPSHPDRVRRNYLNPLPCICGALASQPHAPECFTLRDRRVISELERLAYPWRAEEPDADSPWGV